MPATAKQKPQADAPEQYATICKRVGYANFVPVPDQDAAGEALLRRLHRANRDMTAREGRTS